MGGRIVFLSWRKLPAVWSDDDETVDRTDHAD